MDQRPLELNRRYLLKHTSQTVPAFVSSIDHRTDIGTLTHEPARRCDMNDIGAVSLNCCGPSRSISIAENRATGAFILIDPETNAHRGGGHDYARRRTHRDGEDESKTAAGAA